MKRNFLFMSVLASLFMVGCSQEEITPDSGTSANGEVNTSYMAVNLMSSDVTRAADGYEDGTADENSVSKVRFYFFTENGAAANVKLQGNSFVNYYDWTPGKGDQKDDTNLGDDVESNLAATIVINTKSGDKLPQKMAAVLNPTGLENVSMSLSELKDVVADYVANGLTDKGKFVMFNSVYGKNGAEFSAVPIEAVHLQKTVDLAKSNPVTIYVERSVAKVRVTLGSEIGFKDGKLALKDKDGIDFKVDGQQVYLILDGWSLTADTDNGRLVKKIDPAWDSNWWNGTHRSFWAINSRTAKNRYHNYTGINTSFGSALYTNENAAKLNDEVTINQAANDTKVILKGTLCKADGTPLTLVRHLGAYYADTYSTDASANLPLLKKSILNQLAANGIGYYYETVEEGETVRKQIDIDDLKIVVAEQVTDENSKNNCYVHAQLVEAAASKTWYNTLAEDAEPMTDAVETINGTLENKEIVDWALVWNSGMTYYYYEIVHHGTGAASTKGVVRNHVYDTKVTKIAGLGTPVYNPGLEIYPEKPDPNDHYIAAQINILSWRIVSDEYALEW